ncbi:DUF5906 domain-containing protein [Phenylobacterium conjunctum]|uniref:DUF5906 domain-containing protein n=1 Tax=Phenylobacterium conjunctum TaxID=1298959 RepID=A0ABW3T626_9CAUL
MYTAQQTCEQVSVPGNVQDFLSAVLPDGHIYCVGRKTPDGFRNIFGPTVAWIETQAERFAMSEDVYFALGTFKAGGSRKQDNVEALRSLWLDIDAGPGKPYAGVVEAITALASFRRDLGLPKPWVVASGGGLHVYWPFDQNVDPHVWQKLANALKRAAERQGLEADPSRTADMASVLRIPGTTNHKRGAQVHVMTAGVTSTVLEIATLLAKFSPAPTAVADQLGPMPEHLRMMLLSADLRGVDQAQPDTFGRMIADACGVVDRMRSTQGNVDQPTWYNVLGVLRHCVDGPELAHEWSKGHPGYSARETDQKLEQQASFGPTTCAKLGEGNGQICAGCSHRGRISSPIVLGRPLVPAHVGGASKAQGWATPYLPASLGPIPATMDAEGCIARLNGEFAWVHSWGGKGAYIRRSRAGIERRDVGELKAALANRFVGGDQADGGRKNAFEVWSRHARRQEFDNVVFMPEGGVEDRDLNLWRGLAVQPQLGAWSRMRRHLKDVVCAGDSKAFRYLLRWMAHAVQKPGTAPGTVPILMSEHEGSGKTIVTDWMCRIFGAHGASFNTPAQLLGKFNAHLETLSFIAVNEPSFAGNHEDARKLKSMITDRTWTIEVKHAGVYSIPNRAHMMFTTNEPWAVMAGVGARRFLVLEVATHHARDRAYFDALARQASGGGVEAMLHFLLNLDIEGFSPTAEMPETAALREQQRLSAPPVVQWARDVIEAGGLMGGGSIFGERLSAASLVEDFTAWAQRHGHSRRMTAASMGRWLASLGLDPTKSNGKRSYDIPALSDFEAKLDASQGLRA